MPKQSLPPVPTSPINLMAQVIRANRGVEVNVNAGENVIPVNNLLHNPLGALIDAERLVIPIPGWYEVSILASVWQSAATQLQFGLYYNDGQFSIGIGTAPADINNAGFPVFSPRRLLYVDASPRFYQFWVGAIGGPATFYDLEMQWLYMGA